jgi:hypothetical protein
VAAEDRRRAERPAREAGAFQGEFVWHHHEHEDEMFLVVRGSFRMEFRDRVVELGEGEFLVVPRGVEHRPVAEQRGTGAVVRASDHRQQPAARAAYGRSPTSSGCKCAPARARPTGAERRGVVPRPHRFR